MLLRVRQQMVEGGLTTLKGYVISYSAKHLVHCFHNRLALHRCVHCHSPLPHDRAALVAIAVHVVLQVVHASPVSVCSPVAQSTPNHIDDINRLVMETIERSRSHPEHVSLASMAANWSRSPGGRQPAIAHHHMLREDSESSDEGGDLLPRAKVGRKLTANKHLHMHSLCGITFYCTYVIFTESRLVH